MNEKDCYFYHTIEFPDGRRFQGEWDLTKDIDDYLGHVDFQGKKVLDVGAANGFLTFSMEQRGAKVTSYDLNENEEWDVVPYADEDTDEWLEKRKAHIRKLNNAYRLGHQAFNSKAKLVHGTVYKLPKSIGVVDIAVVGSILLHLRDPWSALRNICSVTKETIVITEKLPRRYLPLKLFPKLDIPWLTFLPDAKTKHPIDGWWVLTPAAIRKMIGVLGFDKSTLTFHKAPLHGKQQQLYTIVAHRTAGTPRAM